LESFMSLSRIASLLLPSLLLPGALLAAEARLVGPAGQCLGVSGVAAERSPLVLAACAASSDNANQRWTLPARGFAGEVRLGDLCLDVEMASADDFTRLQLFGCHGGANQRWQHDVEGRLIGLAGKCLDADRNGGGAVLYGCNGSDDQRFLAQPYEAWTAAHLPLATRGAELVATGDAGIAYQYGGDYVLRSADGGRSWATVGSTDLYQPQGAVTAHPSRPNVLWRVVDYKKIARSDDGGRSWRVVAEATDFLYLLRASRVHPEVVIAIGDEAFWLSQDGGLSFRRQADLPDNGLNDLGNPGALVETPEGHWLLVHLRSCGSGGGGCDGKVLRTADLGLSWQTAFEFEGAYGADLSLSAADPSRIYGLEGDGDVARSDDGGLSFAAVGTLPAAADDHHSDRATIAAHPRDAAKVFAVSAGELWHSDDGGVQWTEIAQALLEDDGYAAYTIAALGPDLLAAVTVQPEDGDSARRMLLSRDGGTTWTADSPAVDGGEVSALVAGARPGLLYAFQHGRRALWRSDDHGRTWQKNPIASCVDQLVADPIESATLYWKTNDCVGGQPSATLLRSRDGGATVEDISTSGLGPYTRLIAFRQGSQTILLAASGDTTGTLRRSTDRGVSWQAVPASLGPIYDLVADGDRAYVITERQVHRSLDGGVTFSLLLDEVSGFFAGGGKYGHGGYDKIVVVTPAGTVASPYAAGIGGRLQLDAHGRLYRLGGSTLRSVDDGRSWQSLDAALIGPTHTVIADAGDPELLVAATANGVMVGRFGDPSTLTLGKGRFRIALGWKAPDGAEGYGRGKVLTNDSGAFWLFSPERSEVVVKVLDGRPINGRFWVFVGSLTNVEFDLEVVDELTGERRSYHNPAGVFASFGDTQAFPLGAPQASLEAARPDFYAVSTQYLVPITSRFQVNAAWEDENGAGQFALGSRLSGDTAAFTFFSPENVELVVNVIDGRAINGHFWVFAASLTNVHYVVGVKDLETGEFKTYSNPAGSFASFGDTSAF
jgi:photosystem II stability/assembly factor-like uncharacterized protein